jgi:hypothetical protein
VTGLGYWKAKAVISEFRSKHATNRCTAGFIHKKYLDNLTRRLQHAEASPKNDYFSSFSNRIIF